MTSSYGMVDAVKRTPIIERRRLPGKPGLDPIAEILAAAAALQDVPRDSTASIPDILFHNRRVAGRIKAVADRIERTWEPKGSVRRALALPTSAREQRREITVAKGRRVRVVEVGPKRQMELSL